MKLRRFLTGALALVILVAQFGTPAWTRNPRGQISGVVTSSASIRQIGQFANTAHTAANSSTWSVTLTGVLAGSTIYLVGMWPNFASTYPTMTTTDGTNTYTRLDRVDDLANKTNGIQGTQSMGHWYAANVPAGTYTVNMAPTTATVEDWVAVVAMEITNVHTASLAGHNIAIGSNIAPGTNNITLSATNAQASALAIGVTFTEVDFTTPSQPTVGTGFTQAIAALWPFNTSAIHDAGQCEWALVGNGSQTATFNANEPTTGAGAANTPNYITTIGMFF